MPLLAWLADTRDVVIIVFGVAGSLLFLVSVILVFFLIKAVLAVKGTVSDLVDDSIKPTLASFRETAETVKGTTEFVGQTAVSPIIRAYGMAAGAKRGLGVLSGLAKRGER